MGMGVGQRLQDLHRGGRIRVDDIGGGANQRFCMRAYDGRITAPGEAKVDAEIPSFHPPERCEPSDQFLVADLTKLLVVAAQ